MRILVFVSLLFLLACDEQAPRSVENNVVLSNVSTSDLEGMWISACEQGAVNYVQHHVKFDKGNYSQEVQFHPDANCTIIDSISSSYSGTYTIGNVVITERGISARELDIVLNYQGDMLSFKDLYFIEGGTLYQGPPLQSGDRPTVLDWDFPYNRQF